MRNHIIKLIGDIAAKDSSVVFLTGDLGFSVVESLQDSMGERFVNMGISEANMISVGSSLSAVGFNVFAYSITPFITARCFEQIRNDVCYQGRPVKLIGVGAGYSYGGLGPSHHALEDAHILASLPNMIVGNPANIPELERLFELTLQADEAVYFRIARESGTPRELPRYNIATGAYLISDGDDLNIITSGVNLNDTILAADRLARRGIKPRVISVPVLKPFPGEHLAGLLASAPVLTVFEGYSGNPLATGVMQTLLNYKFSAAFTDLYVDGFAHKVGNTEFLRAAAGLDAEAIFRQALKLLS